MRVLQVVQPEDGGVAEHVFLLATGLPRHGWEVEVAASPSFAYSDELRRRGVPVHVLDLRRAPGPWDLAAWRALRGVVRRGGYDLVHAHSSKAGALVRLGAARARRSLYTPHCAAFYSAMGSRRTREVYRGVEQLLVPRTRAYLAVCEWERRRLARGLLGARSRVEVVPNGVPPCPAGEIDPELLEFKGDGRLVGLVTTLRPGKDVRTLLEALDRLVRGGREDLRGVIVGTGPTAPFVLSEIARLGLEERARLFGFRQPPARWLRAFDVFVLPTDWEALPLSVLEAMRCGLPVVATDVGGVAEAVHDGVTGRLVPPRDPDVLAATLADLLDDPETAARLGRAGAELAAERFSDRSLVDGVAATYRART